MPDEKPHPFDRPRQLRGQDPEGRRKLAESSDRLRSKMRDAAIARDDALRRKISQKLGFDVDALYEEARAEQAEVDREIRQERELFRKEACALAATERRLFNEQLDWALKKGNLKKHLEKAYHNQPWMTMKLCHEYWGECSPPAGMVGGSGDIEAPLSEAEYNFQLTEPVFGVRYVDTIHPYCRVDAGSARRGYARAWVEQRLTYKHSPPATTQLYDQVDLLISGWGYADALYADVLYIAQSLAFNLDFGGWAQLLLSITIHQNYVVGAADHHAQTVEVVHNTLLYRIECLGARWIWRPDRNIWVSGEHLSLAHDPGMIAHLTYPTLFPAYGRENDEGFLAGDVTVDLVLRCEAEADHRHARGEIGFRHSDGHALRVHQIGLRAAG